MKLIALFFGSFNPIHLGHQYLAEYAFQFSGVDEIWFVVSPRNPLKDENLLIDEQDRFKMIELATQNTPYMKPCDVEFDMPKPSYTIDTLRRLKELYPEDDFVLVIGSDNMAIFDKWKDYQTILDEFSVLVYPREDYPYEDYEEKFLDMQVLEEAPFFDVSSTEIREKIKNGEDVNKWLHPEVIRYIKENELYKS